MFIEGLLDAGAAIAVDADEILVKIVECIDIEIELRLGEGDLGAERAGVTGLGLVGIERGNLLLFGLDPLGEAVNALLIAESGAGERRRVLRRVAERGSKGLVHFVICGVQGLLRILTLLFRGRLRRERAGGLERRLVDEA